LMDPDYGARKFRREEFEVLWFDWREDEVLSRWEDLSLRTLIIPYPKRLQHDSGHLGN
jgi:hypothetical protein